MKLLKIGIFSAALTISIPGICRAAESGVVHVQALDRRMDISSLKQKGVKVHSVDELKRASTGLPEPKERDRWLKKSGLEKDALAWDQLDKDLLVIKATSMEKEDFFKEYPKLDPKKLDSFYKFARQPAGASQ